MIGSIEKRDVCNDFSVHLEIIIFQIFWQVLPLKIHRAIRPRFYKIHHQEWVCIWHSVL